MRKIILFVSMLVFFGCGEGSNFDAIFNANDSKKIQNLQTRLLEYSLNKDYKGELSCWNEIISIDSTNGEYYDGRAKCHRNLASFDTMSTQSRLLELRDLDKAIQLKANSIRYLARAEYWRRYNNNNKALADYNLAVKYLKNRTVVDMSGRPIEDDWLPLKLRASFNFYVLKDSSSAFNDIVQVVNEIKKHELDANNAHDLLECATLLMDGKRFFQADETLKYILNKLKTIVRLEEAYTSESLRVFDHVEWKSALRSAVCRIEFGDYYGALFQIERVNVENNYAKMLKGYCLVKLGQKEFGMKQLKYGEDGFNNGNGPFEKSHYCFSKYYLEYFPRRKDQMSSEVYEDYNRLN